MARMLLLAIGWPGTWSAGFSMSGSAVRYQAQGCPKFSASVRYPSVRKQMTTERFCEKLATGLVLCYATNRGNEILVNLFCCRLTSDDNKKDPGA